MASTRAGKYCAPFLSSVSRLPATYCMRLRALELRADREVVRQHRPRPAAVYARGCDLEAAHVNAIEPQQRQHAGEGRQRAAVMRHRHLGHAEPALENRRGAMPPVVEIAGDDDRQAARRELLEPPRDRLELALASALVQRKMHAHQMQIAPPSRHGHHAVQQPAALVAVVGDVLVLERKERKARQHRVAVVAVVVDGVAAVGMLPLAVRKELVLRLGGAGGEAHGVALVQSLHFLQEHEVRIELPQAFAQLVAHHAAIEMRQSLVDIEGDDAQAPGQGHFGTPAARRSISATMAVNCSVTVLRSAATPISGGSSKSGSISPTYRSSTAPRSAFGWIS